MATTIQPQLKENPRFVLRDVSWQFYEVLLSELGERPALRLTYDRGDLEFMTTSPDHEFLKKMMARLIETLCWELGIIIKCGGSFTHKRKDLLRGLEPDECYWIQHEPAVRGKREIDLMVDPPPDLAVEIDITRSWIDRKSIYAALGVPELWCFNGESLRVFLLRENGEYQRSETSSAFPFLPVRELARFLQFDEQTDELTRLRSFVDWLHEQEFRK